LHRLPARDVPQEVLDEALVHAAQNERPEAVAWLLDHGADPNAGPYQGCGALHLAAAFGAIGCVRLLVAAGADIDRTNDFNGDNAIGWAGYVLERERPGDGCRCGPRVPGKSWLAPGCMGRVNAARRSSTRAASSSAPGRLRKLLAAA